MHIERSGEPFDLDAFLARPLIAHLATASGDGPCESSIWFLWEDAAIWLVANTADSFPKRIRIESRCALGFVEFDVDRGILRHVGMRGSATLQSVDDARLHRFLRRYLGEDPALWNPRFRETVVAGLDLMIRFDPASMVMRDQSYFK